MCRERAHDQWDCGGAVWPGESRRHPGYVHGFVRGSEREGQVGGGVRHLEQTRTAAHFHQFQLVL